MTYHVHLSTGRNHEAATSFETFANRYAAIAAADRMFASHPELDAIHRTLLLSNNIGFWQYNLQDDPSIDYVNIVDCEREACQVAN